MPFNRDLGTRLAATGGDRDVAPFFAGREAEIASVDDAIRHSSEKPQTVFRVFQGAPGAGKTSLLHHLREHRADKALFATLRPVDLTDWNDTLEVVNDAVVGAAGRRWAAARMAATAGDAVRLRSFSAQVADMLQAYLRERFGKRGGCLALTLDEAQLLGSKHADTLTTLHASGLGVPSVLLLAGLSHTSQVLAALGISRSEHESDMVLSRLSDDECASANDRMFNALGIDRSPARGRLSRALAAMSLGWPQHLNRAQHACARELLRVNGDIEQVDVKHIKTESDRARADYYEKRLEHPLLGRLPEFSHKVIVEIAEQKPADRNKLDVLCERMIKREKPPQWPGNGVDLADALVAKGVVCPDPDDNDRYNAPIPSMADWADARLPEPGPGMCR